MFFNGIVRGCASSHMCVCVCVCVCACIYTHMSNCFTTLCINKHIYESIFVPLICVCVCVGGGGGILRVACLSLIKL